MRALFVTTVLSLLCFCTPALGAQSGDGSGSAIVRLQVARRQAQQVERERLLLEAWVAADAEVRAAMEGQIRAAFDPRRSRRSPLPLHVLSRTLRRATHAGQDEGLFDWFDLVDSLDMQVVPGVFEARESGRGEAITVTLASLWKSTLEVFHDVPVKTALVWISPKGERTLAREETVSVANLREGFAMYLRPPISQPATWRLVLELETPLGVVRSSSVPVECLANLKDLREQLLGAVRDPDAADYGQRLAIYYRLDALLTHGVRVGSRVPLGSLIAALSGWPDLTTELHQVPGVELGVPGGLFWDLTSSFDSKRVLLIMKDPREYPEDLLSGPRGVAWRRLAEATGYRVVAGYIPVTPTDDGDLRKVVAYLKESGKAEKVVVVARRDAGRVLPRLLKQEPMPGLDALVLLETIASAVPLPEEITVPSLRVEIGVDPEQAGQREDVTGASRRTRVGLTTPAPFAALEATEALQAWILSL